MRYFRNLSVIVSVLLIFALAPGCVYYNTFYNARTAFNRAEDTRKKAKDSGGRTRVAVNDYKVAIDKSLKVIENYPNSKWYDDALYVLGVSYYYSEQYLKAERRLRELTLNYPESKYVDEANLYIAKTKLQLNEMNEAIAAFESVFKEDYAKSYKSEAAMAIGQYHFKNKNYDKAEPYLKEVRDSLGTDAEALTAQIMIADGYYNQYKFSDGLSAYLQLLGMKPSKDEKYHALYYSADCSYQLQRIEDGMDYLNTLLKEEVYFDSSGTIKLKLAEGYELDEDLGNAVLKYEEVLKEEVNKKAAAMASYKLGLIYQYDHDELVKAKEYYDKAVQLGLGMEIKDEALQKSSDIGKLETFARTIKIDSTTTQDDIDAAALVQYQLAELYWFKLNKPDTAILEMQYLIDSFPSAYDVPKARIALSQMYKEYYEDTAASESILDLIFIEHPSSDLIPEALEVMGLLGTEADTGYALKYIHTAEDFIDSEQIDSARYYYQHVVDNYPESDYYLQARFALIWLTEQFESPGDSSLIFAYQQFADSFPQSEWGITARSIATGQVRPARERVIPDTLKIRDNESEEKDTVIDERENLSARSGYSDPLAGIYIGPDGDSIYNLHKEVVPIRFSEAIEDPIEVNMVEWFQYDFYFQIKLDFIGKVEDLKLMSPCEIDKLNIEVERYIAAAEFDVSAMPLDQQGKWQVYKYTYKKPNRFGR